MVVQYDLDQRFSDTGCRCHLVHVHTETAVTSDVHDRLVRPSHLCTDGRSQTVAHGSQTSRGKKCSRFAEFIILRRPHLVLSHVRADDGVAFRKLVKLFDHIGTGKL